MYEVTIENGATFIYEKVYKGDSWSNNLLGFLINRQGIKELINMLPISKYYVLASQGNSIEISKEQAFALYDMIIDYHNNHSEEMEKQVGKICSDGKKKK